MKILQKFAELLWGTSVQDAAARTRALRRLGRSPRRYATAQPA